MASRTKLAGESPLQRLARELGRTEQAVLSRRQRLAEAPKRRKAAERERARLDERDRAILAAIKAGASFKDAARQAGISAQAAHRMVKRKAPELTTGAKDRGEDRRIMKARIARELAPRLLDAALAGEGVTLKPAEVADLVSGLKRDLHRERESGIPPGSA